MSGGLFIYFLLRLALALPSQETRREEYIMRDDWPWSDGLLDACYPDPCNDNGFCKLTDDGADYWCKCVHGFYGENCTESLTMGVDVCNPGPCQNGATCFLVWTTESCFCAPGWGGTYCDEEVEDYDACEHLTCNQKGTCVIDEYGAPGCVCDNGYNGEACEYESPYCTATQFLHAVNVLITDHPEWSLDCAYMSTQIWSMVPMDDSGYPGNCQCLYQMKLLIPDVWDTLGNSCVIDNMLTLNQALDMYCPMHCSEDDIDNMLLTLVQESEYCEHFIYDRASMPQYRRDYYKCLCMLDVADTYEEAQAIMPCPFAFHTAHDGAVAWQHCADDTICDFVEIYQAIEHEVMGLDPIVAESCLNVTSELAGILPGGPGAYELAEYLCPCYEGLLQVSPSTLNHFDCLSVTFFEITVLGIMEKICYETVYLDYYCTWNLTWATYELSKTDFTHATSCLEGFKLGDQIIEVNDNFDELFCVCYHNMQKAGLLNMVDVDYCASKMGWIVPEPTTYCDTWLEEIPTAMPTLDPTHHPTLDPTEGVTPYPSFDEKSTNAEITGGEDGEFATSETSSGTNSTTVWTIINIPVSILLVGLLALNVWLYMTTGTNPPKLDGGGIGGGSTPGYVNN